MPKKKILVTASTFPRWEQDTEPRFILDYCIGLSKFYDVTALVPAAVGAKHREILEGIPVIRYHYFPIHAWETLCYPGAIVPRIKEKKARVLLVPFLLLAQLLNLRKYEKEFDLIHAHWLIPQGILTAFCKKPFLVTGHGGDVGELNGSVFRLLKKRCLKKASAVTVVSKHLQDILKEKYGAANTHIIPMGCNTSYFSPANHVENYFGQGSKKVVLFVGRLAEKKGTAYLIRAMQSVDALLVIAGSGPLEAACKALVKELHLEDKVRFLGPKPHTQLRAVYASADAFAAPSVTTKNGDVEGFGLVILEAMASGLPVVASRSGGITDIIRDGENGLLAGERNVEELAAQINAVLSSSALSHKLSLASLATAAQFDYSVIAEKYHDIMENSCH
ncbi:MAG: glycosyltransferase [Lachnospiraceae bacterium]|nr:glycosyltransferase [Lachnospiraceae bacterium]